MLCVKQGGNKYFFFWVFGMTRPGIELWIPGPMDQITIIHLNQPEINNTLLVWAVEYADCTSANR